MPEARARLETIADQMRRDGLGTYANEIERQVLPLMTRRSPARRGPVKHPPVTPAIAAEIRRLADATDLHTDEIAARVGVNPGRVSEVLNSAP